MMPTNLGPEGRLHFLDYQVVGIDAAWAPILPTFPYSSLFRSGCQRAPSIVHHLFGLSI